MDRRKLFGIRCINLLTYFWRRTMTHHCNLLEVKWLPWHDLVYSMHHRRRLLEMTGGPRFPLPAFSLLLPLLALVLLLPALPPIPPFYSSFHPLSHLLPAVPPSFPCPFPPVFCPSPSLDLNLPFKSSFWGLEERCQLPRGSGRSPAAKRFGCIFRLKSVHFLPNWLISFCQKLTSKLSVGRLGCIASLGRGATPHGVGAYAM